MAAWLHDEEDEPLDTRWCTRHDLLWLPFHLLYLLGAGLVFALALIPHLLAYLTRSLVNGAQHA